MSLRNHTSCKHSSCQHLSESVPLLCKLKSLRWQLCSLTGGVALPSYEARRQQDISTQRGHLRLNDATLLLRPELCRSPYGVGAFTSLWSSVRPAEFLFYQCWSVKDLIGAVVKGNNLVSLTGLTGKRWQMLLSFLLYLLHFCNHIRCENLEWLFGDVLILIVVQTVNGWYLIRKSCMIGWCFHTCLKYVDILLRDFTGCLILATK